MSLRSIQSLRRLQAMDVAVWVRRDRPLRKRETARPRAEPRIRLEAGSGDWVLLVEERGRTRHSSLLADIRGTLGAECCRFGKWSDSPDSGIALGELVAAGVKGVIDFRHEDQVQQHAALVAGGDLDDLSASAEARQRLWQRMRMLMEG